MLVIKQYQRIGEVNDGVSESQGFCKGTGTGRRT